MKKVLRFRKKTEVCTVVISMSSSKYCKQLLIRSSGAVEPAYNELCRHAEIRKMQKVQRMILSIDFVMCLHK